MSGDLYYSSVKLLLHGNGSDASTTFTDNSSTPKTVTAHGSAQNSVTQYKYGTASIKCLANGDYLSNDGSANFSFGTGDFTIEFWFYGNSISTNTLYDGGGTGGSYPIIIIGNNAANKLEFSAGSTLVVLGTTTIVSGQWYHIAVSRLGTNTRLFLNGVQEGSTGADATNYGVSTNMPYIGAFAANASILGGKGYFDDIRVTKGIARYVSNFDVPPSEFPNVAPNPARDRLFRPNPQIKTTNLPFHYIGI
jgi:hypothetical protein